MKLKLWLKWAGIFNIVFGILLFLYSRSTIIPVLFLVASGFYYQTYFSRGNIYQNKWSLIILGIINLLCNFISGIITLEIASLIKSDLKYEECLDNKSNKINILLQIGVVLILLSGIMIATNQSIIVPDIIKIIGLMLLSIVFFFLSYMSKKYLKLESSFKTYYILGMSFIVISFIGAYYYNLLGSISINGYNYLYFYPLLYILISICLGFVGKVINNRFCYYLSVLGVYVSLFSWFNALGLDIIINLLLITFSSSIINFIYNPSSYGIKVVRDTSKYISLALIPINMFLTVSNSFNYFSVILLLISTLNVFHLYLKEKTNILSIISIPTLLINSSLVAFMSDDLLKIEIVIFQVMVILFYNLIKFIKLDSFNKIFNKLFKIMFNISIIFTAFISLFIDSTAAVIVCSLMVLQNIIDIIKMEKHELYLEPFKSLLLAISALLIFNEGINVDFVFNLFILSIIELSLYLLIKHNGAKIIHYVMYLVLVGNIVLNPSDNLFLALISLISSLIPLGLSIIKKEDNKVALGFIFAFIVLSNANSVFININYLNYLFVFVALTLYAYINKNDLYKKYYALFASCLLLFSFTSLLDIKYVYLQCINLGIFSYLGAIISSLIKEKDSKDLFILLYSTFIILINMFTSEILIGVIICLITLLLIVYAFFNDFKKTKISAIILFVLNLIYMLRDFWADIPLAVYLLILGFILIGVVVVKEIKDNK